MTSKSSSTTDASAVSSAIVGDFKALEGMPDDTANSWAFEYNQAEGTVVLQVRVGIPPLLIDNSNQSLNTDITSDDIDQLINWLAIVKINLAKSSSSSANNK